MASSRSALVPFVVVFGGEPFFIDQDRARAKGWKDRSVIELDGDKLPDTAIVEACEASSITDQPRTVIVEDAHKIKGDKALAAYIEATDPGNKRVILVALCRSEKLPEVWAKAAKKGRAQEHRKLKTFETNNEVVRWVQAEAVRHQVSLAEGVAEHLVLVVGPDLYRLANELSKVARFIGNVGKVQIADVSKVVAPHFHAEPFQVAEAALARDLPKAMNTLSLVYKTLGQEAHVPVVSALQRQVEKLVVARQMLDRQATPDDIATAIGMNVWRYKNHTAAVVKKHTLGSLIAHMGRLRKLELEVKGPFPSKRTRVELTVLAIAG